ncbi:Retrovirus-related Pol polyprotein from transposon 17.6 [Vitis vinifera]|uniref:Retrovirus-related Pol polyprotein from transposon 17.6 n=1 Tax=Vitis vinifera TaxID=29760 RepID=A0A438H6M2_VITVI|nr:Retrovirus-related Pol polyprotein from transposon 17.6 [Vitis vinifera]
MDGMQNDLSQKIDNLQYSISRLTNLNTVQEKGRFPSQPHQNPKGIHEVETHEGESSQVNIPLLDMIKQVPTYAKFLKDLCTIKRGLNVNKKAFLTEQVSAIIQCKSPLKYKDPGCPTISVMIGGKLNESLEDLEEGLSEPADVLATLQGWRRKEEIYLYSIKRRDKMIPWVSPTQVVPKKSGITVVQNEKGEEIATRLTSGWRVLERVSGHPFYCFLDGYSGYFQIEIDVEDQEKTTFTCPFGTYAYRRMPFGLCNAPATFQRCMLSIFSDMVERIMEVFMDDITIYGGTFEECLVNLEAVLKRCIEKDLVLNWEKCHFMVHQGIVLGHIISEKGIEVDKAKVELIAKLPSPTLCQKSFDQLKQFLTTAPIVRAPNWQLPFEVMCDASDFAIGAVLGQREDGKPYVIYYASKTLNELKETTQLQRKNFPSEWKAQDRKHFFAKIHAYYWEEPFLFKYCADQIIRKCVPEEEQQGSSAIAMRMLWRPLCLSENSHEGLAIRVYLAIAFQRFPHHV